MSLQTDLQTAQNLQQSILAHGVTPAVNADASQLVSDIQAQIGGQSGPTWYSSPSGSDSNPGTLAQPFKTVAKGLSKLVPGATLYLRAGTYPEFIHNNVPSGTSWTSPVTVSAYQGEQAIIQPGTGQFVMELVGKYSYIIFQNLIFDGTGISSTNIYFDQNGSTAPDHVRFTGCEIRYSGDQGVAWDGAGSILTSYCELVACSVHGNTKSNLTHGVYIQGNNCLVDHCDVFGNGGHGLQVYDGSGVGCNNNIIRNSKFHNNNTAGSTRCELGIYVGSGNLVYNNLVYSGYDGIISDIGATGTLIYNNTVTGMTDDGIRTGYGGPGITTNCQIKNNISYGNTKNDIRDYGTNTDIEYNLIGKSSIGNFGSGATIKNNIVSSNPKFVSTTDFHLQAGSPAIESGTTLSQVTVDFDGVTRDTPYEIGAYEHE